jgi:hypothetical protein
MAVIRGQSYVYVYVAWDTASNTRKTGDAANHTVYISKDGSDYVQASNAPSEILLPGNSPTGTYRVTLTASEMDANTIVVYVVSSTSGVTVPVGEILTERGRVDTTLSSRATAGEVWSYTSRTLTDPVTVGNYSTGKSPAEQILINASYKINTDVDGNVYLSDQDHQAFAGDVVSGLEYQGYTSTRAGYLDQLGPSGTVYSKLDQLQYSGSLVRAVAESVTDKTGYALSASARGEVADQVWNTTRGTGRQSGTFGYYLDAPVSSAGGSGSSDWTTDERAMIRYVLGIDGVQQAPSSSTPGWIKSIKATTDKFGFDANNRVYANAQVVGDKTGYTLTTGEHSAISADVQAGLNAQGYTSTRASYLDAAISTRLASSQYTAPDNASISAIKAKTDALSFSGGNVNARAVVVSDKSDYTLASSERTSIAQAVMTYVVEGTWTLVKLVRLMASALLGLVSGSGTGQVKFRDLGNTKDRITATVDSSGNRLSITLDGD